MRLNDVDISVEPTPTGAAARLAAQHVDEQPLKLYGAWFCPFVQRSWITLEEKKIPYQYLEVNPYKKEPDFLRLNSRGLVPVLVMPAASPWLGDGGGEEGGEGGGESQRSLMESTVICEYLDDAYSDESVHGPRLLPLDPYQRARAHLWIDHIATRIVPAFYKLLQHTRGKQYTVEAARAELLGHMRALAGAMDARGPFFLGRDVSLVDISLAPWVERLFLLDLYKEGGFRIPEDEAEGPAGTAFGAAGGLLVGGPGPWARWRRWAAAVEERKSVRDTTSDREAYVRVYRRYAEDTTGSQVARATRQGGRLP
ncbi:Glutathione S-transferase omega-1 [Escovopsis weberi]|uniref:Glutathione S-transferase omega-1 n=1 Tax=Escovopsis weberi TaxID=150374 RepID=A0A0M8N953_ESCWE|nr:Glutathione S-transferase omega-1 [Escovopsis weberi]